MVAAQKKQILWLSENNILLVNEKHPVFLLSILTGDLMRNKIYKNISLRKEEIMTTAR